MHVLGTAGHVDHGKSTLVERLTGIDPDRFAEEKRRGLTIDLGFAWVPLPSGREVGLIDVPGHERFIKNMLSGAGGVSVCLFVVAANEGWKPQSAEHLAILDVLGVSHGVVALTKSDLVDAETLEIARAEVVEKLASSSLAGCAVVPCSAVTGAGINDLVDALDAALDGAPPTPDLGRPRLWVDRVFTIAGAGTVVTGTLMGGCLAVADEVEVAPKGRRARVRSIQSHKKQVEEIGPGNRVALNLVGLDRQGAERGDAVVRPAMWRATSRVDAVIRLSPAEIAGRSNELREKGAHLLYVGSAETPVRVRLLGDDKLVAGGEGYAQLQLRDPLPLGRGDRFVLRDVGRVATLGGGVVLDPLPDRARRADERHLDLLSRLNGADDRTALVALVNHLGEIDLDEARLRVGSLAGDPDGSPPAGVVLLQGRFVSKDRVGELETLIVDRLARHHEERPLEPAMDAEALRADLNLDPATFAGLVERIADVVKEGAGVRLATHSIGLTPEQQLETDRLLTTIDGAGFQPPLAPTLDADPALLRSLVQSGQLVRIENFYMTGERAAEARAKVRAAIEETGPITVAQIRDLLATTRKYAVPLCEWLDSTGATVRKGDTRLLGPKP